MVEAEPRALTMVIVKMMKEKVRVKDVVVSGVIGIEMVMD